MVRGEAGIGKTTLVDALRAGVGDGTRVVTAHADEFGASTAGGVAAQLDPDLPVPPDGADPAEAAAVLQEAFLARLAERAAAAPQLVVVENLHWADAATVGVLARLALAVRHLAVLVVATTRPQPAGPEHQALVARVELAGGEVVDLLPLDDTAMVAIAADLLDGEVGPALRDQVGTVGGNPFYLGELLAILQEAGALHRDGTVVDAEPGLRAPALPVTILQHLRSLSPPTIELLGLASVLGATFTAAEVALIAPRPAGEYVPLWREALAAGVLGERGDRLTFRHDLIRDALYADLPLPARQQLHRSLAGSFDAVGAPPGRVAEHLQRAGELADDAAVELLDRTARSLAPSNPAMAADLFASVAERIPAGPQRDEILADFALCSLWAGRFAVGERAAADSIDRRARPRLGRDLVFELANAYSGQARMEDAIRVCELALRDPDRDAPSRARLGAIASWARLLTTDLPRAEPEARQVVLDARAAGEPLAESMAFSTLAMCARVRGQLLDAVRLAEECDRAYQRDPHRGQFWFIAQVVRTTVLCDLDRLDEALAVLAHDESMATALGSEANLAYLQHARAWTLYLLGRWDDAVGAAEAGLRFSAATGAGHCLTSHAVLALIALARGDLVAAERHCAAGEAEYRETGSPHNVTMLQVCRARLHESEGRLDDAVAAVYDPWWLGVTFGIGGELPLLGPELVRLAVAAGRPGLAEEVPLQLWRVGVFNAGVDRIRAVELHARGLLDGDPDVLLEAVAAYRRGARPVETAAATVDAAVSLARAGRSEEVPPLAEEALGTLDRVAATRDRAIAEARLRDVGVVVGRGRRRRRARTGWEALTDAELKVVRLVAERLTNPEIARRMFVSPRTVQTHVSHALAKLGVSTRAELAAAAERHAGWRLVVDEGGTSAD